MLFWVKIKVNEKRNFTFVRFTCANNRATRMVLKLSRNIMSSDTDVNKITPIMGYCQCPQFIVSPVLI